MREDAGDGGPERTIGRRRALALLCGGIVAAVAAACGRKTATSSASTTTTGATAATTGAGATSASCSLALDPELTQGPFWLTDHPQASDLVEDRKGVPLALKLTVVDQACRPISGTKIDIWHCDAAGTYAGVGNGGGPPSGGGGSAATRTSPESWLQGYQVAGDDGTVSFATIYPGWYRGRAVHIHVKVFVGGTDHHTGQLFFPDDLSRLVFASAPYKSGPDTTNAQDSIFRGAGSSAVLAPARRGSGYAAAAQLVVRR